MARSVGKENSATARAEALKYLNDTIDELNTYGPWLMLRKESTGNAFAASTASYALSSDIYRLETLWVEDASNNPLWEVRVMDYAAYKNFDPLTEFDFARYAVVRNLHADSKVTFIGAPGADTPTELYSYGYIARIPQITDDGAVIDVPREMQRAIVEGAKYLMADNAPTADEAVRARRFANYQRLVARLRDIDRNNPAERPRWRLPSGSRGLTEKFFRIAF